MKNIEASIRARLTNLAKKENIGFQLIILRYLQERLLYRLSLSHYISNFCLKGGVLLYAWGGSKTRTTSDIDFLSNEISNNIQTIKNAFVEICNIPCPSDGVLFKAETITAETITEQDKYNGIRLHIDAGFDSIKQRLQIDIGFSDVVTPAPQKLEYPVLLTDSEIPVIPAYSQETVIAEKFQAMIELSAANSRMKDFYDVFNLLIAQRFDDQILEEAIKSTFRNRNTSYIENHSLFSIEFATNSNRLKMWQAFLNKIGQNKELEFSQVITTISDILQPMWERLRPN